MITRGGADDIADAGRLIREAASWLIGRGLELWGEKEISGEELERVARAGELVLARVDRQAAACMYLHREDRQFWPHVPEGEALYVHRLTVGRNYAGRGYAHAMLDWAAEEVRRLGRRYLRLDCEPRPKLLKLYRNAGFLPVDAKPFEVASHFVIRHQRIVTEVS